LVRSCAVDLDGERIAVHIFSMRSMASGGAFHVANHHPREREVEHPGVCALGVDALKKGTEIDSVESEAVVPKPFLKRPLGDLRMLGQDAADSGLVVLLLLLRDAGHGNDGIGFGFGLTILPIYENVKAHLL
jgi:hypothetical protein